MLTIYWIPRTGDPIPRLIAFDAKERKFQVIGTKVKELEGALRYIMPDNAQNRARLENIKEPWHIELPKKGEQKTSKKKIVEAESSEEDFVLRTPLDREELIEMLDNNGIAFKKNQKTKTLFEKLPDDISRNFQLVESSVAVQT